MLHCLLILAGSYKWSYGLNRFVTVFHLDIKILKCFFAYVIVLT